MRPASHVLIQSFLLTGIGAQECTLTRLTLALAAANVEEGESALRSETFTGRSITISPSNAVHFIDSTGRIRRVTSDGTLITVAGSGRSGPVQMGPALESPSSGILQLAFSPSGVLHFRTDTQIFKLESGRIALVAGSGKPGFNGDSGAPALLNLGRINHFTFDATDRLLVLDFNRLRRLQVDVLQTIAGSSARTDGAGPTGDGGPATNATLYFP